MILGSSTSASSIAGTQSADNQAQLEEDLNQFLTLLVTQLENQDPLDPMDSTEFTSQLVQFASVEQQIFQNANLEQLVSLQQNTQISSMVNFIDRVVEVPGQALPLENGQAEFTYTLPVNAKSATIFIRDPNGVTVFETEAETSSGQHTFVWDGKDNNGQTVEDGEYAAVVTGLDGENEVLDITQTAFGRVTGVGVNNGEPTFFMGDVEALQIGVISVKEAPAAAAASGNE
jgi:flagellar basal-body rod modification protein FlgD